MAQPGANAQPGQPPDDHSQADSAFGRLVKEHAAKATKQEVEAAKRELRQYYQEQYRLRVIRENAEFDAELQRRVGEETQKLQNELRRLKAEFQNLKDTQEQRIEGETKRRVAAQLPQLVRGEVQRHLDSFRREAGSIIQSVVADVVAEVKSALADPQIFKDEDLAVDPTVALESETEPLPPLGE